MTRERQEHLSRQGRFTITRDAMEQPNGVKAVQMLALFPLRCEFDYARDQFLITAICDRFEPIPSAQMPPLYKIEMQTDDDGTLLDVRVVRDVPAMRLG